MKKNNFVTSPLLNHKPITRRDFIAQGYVSSLGFVLAPSVLSMMSSVNAYADAAVCAQNAPVLSTPVLIFDLAGGANLAGSDFMVGKAGGQLDYLAANSYQSLGLPPDQEPMMAGRVVTVNGRPLGQGLAFHVNSDILIGMKQTAMTALPNVDGVVFATASNDDTSNNPHNPAFWLYKAGAKGNLVNIIGNNNSDAGGNAIQPAMSFDPSVRSVQVSNANQAKGLIQLGALGNLFLTGGVTNNTKVKKILAAAEATSSRKLASFNNMDLNDQIKQLVQCGYINAQDLVGKFSQSAVDPTMDANVTAAFPNIAGNADQARTASVAKLVLDGYAGVGTVTIGGCDYHGAGRENQALKNQSIGQLIGGAMMLAKLKNQDLMVIVYSDGGVSADSTPTNTTNGKGRFGFTGDSGSRSLAAMMLYKKDGAPSLVDNTRQVGAYADGGSVNRTIAQTSDNVQNLAQAFVANYLALSGNVGQLTQVVGTQTLSAELNKYVKFNKIR